MRPLTIIIPSRTPRLIHRALASIGPYDPKHVRVIVGDNSGVRLVPPTPGLVTVPISEPFIFARAINTCAKYRLPESDLFLMNDDCVVETPGWIDNARLALSVESTAVYGVLSPQIVGIVGNPDQRLAIRDGDVEPTFAPICFMAAFIRHQVWEQVGLLDERFTGYGGEDVDFCRRVVSAPMRPEAIGISYTWRLGILGGITVHHEGSLSYKDRYSNQVWQEAGQTALKIFEAKWGPGPQLGHYHRGSIGVLA